MLNVGIFQFQQIFPGILGEHSEKKKLLQSIKFLLDIPKINSVTVTADITRSISSHYGYQQSIRVHVKNVSFTSVTI